MIKLSLISIFQFLLMSCFAQLDTKAIDHVFSEWDDPNSPGCALGIFRDGEIVYAKGYGSANLEYSIPNSATSVYRIGSTSKQFTAACIVLLEQQGKLKFENTLSDYFPEFPAYAQKITIRHLLNHTSGLRDYLTLSYLKGLSNDDFYTDRDIMRWLINQKDLNFETGSEYVYCNSGYWLLGQIVKEITGKSMAEYAHQEIFEPLGMKNTHFHDDHTQIVPNRASGYQPHDGNYVINMTTLDMIGDGGIFTSIEDIKIWDDAFYSSSTLNSQFWEEMVRQGQLNDNTTIEYASGLMIGEYKGLHTVRHGGAFVGFRAELLRFPDQKLTIAIFANRGDANASGKANEVADIILKDAFKETPKKEISHKVDKKETPIDQNLLIGDYEVQPGVVITVSIANDKVHFLQSWNNSEYDVERSSGNTFQLPGVEGISFRFSNLKDGFTQTLEVNQRGGISEFKRKKSFDQTSMNNEDFIGTYYSDELDVNYEISLENGSLYLAINQSEPEKLTLSDIDQFYGPGLIKFLRKNDLVTGFVLDVGRVKNLKFNKQ